MCHFNFDLNPVCKTCSWNPFEVSKLCTGDCCFAPKPGRGRVSPSGAIKSSPNCLCMYFTGPQAITMLEVFAFLSRLFFTVGEFHQSAQPIRLDTVSWYR